MPKYLATVKQVIVVKVTVHAANEAVAKARAEQVVRGFAKTTGATTLKVQEL
ncbi:hypothetical protein SAMN05421774_10895 [Gemmobacter megaterium]|uniref:Uncharacterized protein n=1 Tax=Gemmobacter megaterium TaxID=1086013 RepID=A0A1N7QBH5_9RHOB|nr:hypothetical protein [Gemmobacter megaterium]GGE24028.1 hypothetical protein GCM10011345_32500 [Gemmobacter megaterium]SIT20248.1 hypothetical protein SAMN05421774_10895 [Gemmobacter megaterium]